MYTTRTIIIQPLSGIEPHFLNCHTCSIVATPAVILPSMPWYPKLTIPYKFLEFFFFFFFFFFYWLLQPTCGF